MFLPMLQSTTKRKLRSATATVNATDSVYTHYSASFSKKVFVSSSVRGLIFTFVNFTRSVLRVAMLLSRVFVIQNYTSWTLDVGVHAGVRGMFDSSAAAANP